MADIDEVMGEEAAPEIPEVLENLLLFALDECKNHILDRDALEEEGAEPEEDPEIILDGSIPFTVLDVKDNLFIETHPGNTEEECYALARHTVAGARGASAYALCYDGYIETDDGRKDAIIAEGGIPGADEGYAVGLMYKKLGTVTMFEAEAIFVGEAPNFMAGLKDVAEYDDADIDERYLVDADDDDEDMIAAGEGAAAFAATHPDTVLQEALKQSKPEQGGCSCGCCE